MAAIKQNLVIVESPAKARTIERYLGKKFVVKASMGHLRDLPKSKLGVDVEHNFAPDYVTVRGKTKLLSELKKLAKNAPLIYLATDPDREGEAIAWHILGATGLPEDRFKRLEFHEITEGAIKAALDQPRTIDERLVNAQQARRILDRLVGYKISHLLGRNLSAGRVQSAALKMIIERERERQAFVPVEYYNIKVELAKDRDRFKAIVISHGDQKLDRLGIKTAAQAQAIKSTIEGALITVTELETKESKRTPGAPFITSSLQREASNRFGMTPKRTMRAAQILYEAGHITYMRTDSFNISEQAIVQIREFIKTKFGSNSLSAEPRRYKKKVRGAQEAHEAIRPTNPGLEPAVLKQSLKGDEAKIYELIWRRSIATQMSEAIIEQTIARLKAGNVGLESRGERIATPGFIAVYTDSDAPISENMLPVLSQSETVKLASAVAEQKFTEPTARYSQATLIKALEDNGIGRPSTYAMIIDKIINERAYASLEEGKIIPQLLGFAVNDYMEKNFENVVNLKFTAQMEEELDEVAEGEYEWQKLLHEFYDPFALQLEKANYMEPVPTELPCPECQGKTVLKSGPFGPYLQCEQEHKSSYPPKKLLDVPCPLCGAPIIERKTKKRNRLFWGCSTFPKCKFASWDKPLNEACPTCGKAPLYEKGKQVICKNEECGYKRDVEDKHAPESEATE